MSVASLWKGLALKYVAQLSLICPPFFGKLNQLLIASFTRCTLSGVRTFFRKKLFLFRMGIVIGGCNLVTNGLSECPDGKPTEKTVVLQDAMLVIPFDGV